MIGVGLTAPHSQTNDRN